MSSSSGVTDSTIVLSPTGTSAAVRDRLRRALARAPLSVPLTPVDAAGHVDLSAFQHVVAQLAAGPGAVLVCSEPSHLASLTMREYAGLVDVAVDVAQGTAPVVVGIGHARTTAAEFAQTAVLCGADAGLLMLPEPGGSPAESLVGHVRRVSSATTLPLLVRQGTAAVARAASWVPQLGDVPTVIGLQDCSGELGQAQAVRLAAPTSGCSSRGAWRRSCMPAPTPASASRLTPPLCTPARLRSPGPSTGDSGRGTTTGSRSCFVSSSCRSPT